MVEEAQTQHRFTAEIETIGKPYNGGEGWDILLDWKLPGSKYNQHISGQNWDDIKGFEVGQTRDWVLNIGNLKSNKSGRYASDYFWNWDKTGNSKPPVVSESDAYFTGKPDTPSGLAGGGYQNPSASRYTKDELIVRQVAAKGAFDMICAQIYMPESFDELLETFYHKIMGYRQGYEQGEPEVGGLVEEAKKLGAEAFLEGMANEPPPPPPAPAPEPAAHYCEKHKVEYEKYDKDRATPMYAHKWNDNKHWCVEGNDSLLDEKGQPVTEATML